MAWLVATGWGTVGQVDPTIGNRYPGIGPAEVLKLLDPERTAEEETLTAATTQLAEYRDLFGKLDALRYCLRPQSISQVDDRLHQAARRRRPMQIADEGAVNLDGIHPKLSKVAQRRVAGSEIVNGQFRAYVGQPAQDALSHFGLCRQHRLGDLKDQEIRR